MKIRIIGGKEADEALDILESLHACVNIAEAAGDLSDASVNDFVLINTDEKNICEALKGNKARVITYGLNGKASVTASSIVEAEYKTIQCCIQRGIPTFEGNLLEEQEFPVTVKTRGRNVYSVLAAVTVALIGGVTAEDLSRTVIS